VAKQAKNGVKATAAEAASMDGAGVALRCVAAWFVPGAGHLWLGRRQKGIVFLVVLTLLFALGLFLEGRLFPVRVSEPLVALAAVADMGLGLPFLVARLAGFGGGRVVAATYEYGNTFLIVAGLLNFLVILDVYDIALGRK
jgi:hypothetical protein